MERKIVESFKYYKIKQENHGYNTGDLLVWLINQKRFDYWKPTEEIYREPFARRVCRAVPDKDHIVVKLYPEDEKYWDCEVYTFEEQE